MTNHFARIPAWVTLPEIEACPCGVNKQDGKVLVHLEDEDRHIMFHLTCLRRMGTNG